jgi:hypothetical protein
MRKVNVYTFAGAELTLDWACFQVFSKVTISVQCSHSVVAHYVTKKTTSLYHKATALKDENGTGRYLPRGTGSPLFCKFQWPLSSDSQFGSIGAHFAACALRERYELAGRLSLQRGQIITGRLISGRLESQRFILATPVYTAGANSL